MALGVYVLITPELCTKVAQMVNLMLCLLMLCCCSEMKSLVHPGLAARVPPSSAPQTDLDGHSWWLSICVCFVVVVWGFSFCFAFLRQDFSL